MKKYILTVFAVGLAVVVMFTAADASMARAASRPSCSVVKHDWSNAYFELTHNREGSSARDFKRLGRDFHLTGQSWASQFSYAFAKVLSYDELGMLSNKQSTQAAHDFVKALPGLRRAVRSSC